MAGAFTGEGKNKQMERAKENAKFAAVASSTAQKPENSAGPKKIKKTAHGYNTGDVIVFKTLTGGTGLVAGRPYYVIKNSTSEFEVAWTKALAEASTGIEFSVEIKEAGTEIFKIVEHTGAKTKRKETAFGAIVNGTCEDTTAHEIEATSAVTISWGMYWTAETNGELIAVSEIAEKTLAEADIYKLTNGKLEDTAVA
jgi:hypothetical protein